MMLRLPKLLITMHNSLGRLIKPSVLESSKKLIHYTYFNNNRTYGSNLITNEPENNELDREQPRKQFLGSIERKLMIKFTCKKCQTINTKTMSKLAYEKGLVIIRCDGCQNNHLIADNLGWFEKDFNRVHIERELKRHGDTIKQLNKCNDGQYEIIENEKSIIANNTCKPL